MPLLIIRWCYGRLAADVRIPAASAIIVVETSGPLPGRPRASIDAYGDHLWQCIVKWDEKRVSVRILITIQIQ